MGMYVQQVPVKFVSTAVAVGTIYLDTQSYPFPLTVTAIPAGGGSITVSYSTTPNAAGLGASATWITWPSGTVTATTNDYLKSPVSGLRFVAATSAGTVEVAA